MRSYLSRILLAQLISLGLMGMPLAQDLPRAVVAVLDYAKILKVSDAAKDVGRQIRQYRDGSAKEIRADELRLRAAETTLKRERSALRPGDFDKRRQEFREEVLAAQKRGQNRKRQLDRAFKKAMDQIQGTVIPIVQAMTKLEGYTLVVDKSQVLFASRALDITDKVLLKLNRKLRTVTVPKPQ